MCGCILTFLFLYSSITPSYCVISLLLNLCGYVVNSVRDDTIQRKGYLWISSFFVGWGGDQLPTVQHLSVWDVNYLASCSASLEWVWNLFSDSWYWTKTLVSLKTDSVWIICSDGARLLFVLQQRIQLTRFLFPFSSAKSKRVTPIYQWTW